MNQSVTLYPSKAIRNVYRLILCCDHWFLFLGPNSVRSVNSESDSLNLNLCEERQCWFTSTFSSDHKKAIMQLKINYELFCSIRQKFRTATFQCREELVKRQTLVSWRSKVNAKTSQGISAHTASPKIEDFWKIKTFFRVTSWPPVTTDSSLENHLSKDVWLAAVRLTEMEAKLMSCLLSFHGVKRSRNFMDKSFEACFLSFIRDIMWLPSLLQVSNLSKNAAEIDASNNIFAADGKFPN